MVCGRSDFARTKRDTVDGSSSARRYKIDGFEVIELPLAYSNYDSLLKRSWIFIKFALRSILLALRQDYDLLFATSTPLTAALPGIVMKLFRRKPFVFEVRDLWPELPKAMGVVTNPLALRTMGLLEWLAYRTSDACVGLSPGIADGIKRRSRPNHPIIMIPNGCDLHLFHRGQRRDLCLTGVYPDDFVAVFSGAHGLANGLHAALDAASVLKKRQRRDIKFVFIGDGKLKPALRERAQTEKLDNCLFLQPVPKRELTGILGCADVGLMLLANVPAFYYGTSPNKFFDYLASGLPVLNNYPGWLSDLITTHRCGLAVPPDNPEAFADALQRMAEGPALRETMHRNARSLAEAEFSRDKLAAQFVSWLEVSHRQYGCSSIASSGESESRQRIRTTESRYG
jgi:glycosyltransferase involved in cell wall biosynthesis